MVNEWLGKSPEHVSSDLSPCAEVHNDISNHVSHLPAAVPNRLYFPPAPSSGSFGKKRWLRQAISEVEDHPLDSPPCPPDNFTPLKKRRLARESVTSEPPATPPPGMVPTLPDEDLLYGKITSGQGAYFSRLSYCEKWQLTMLSFWKPNFHVR